MWPREGEQKVDRIELNMMKKILFTLALTPLMVVYDCYGAAANRTYVFYRLKNTKTNKEAYVEDTLNPRCVARKFKSELYEVYDNKGNIIKDGLNILDTEGYAETFSTMSEVIEQVVPTQVEEAKFIVNIKADLDKLPDHAKTAFLLTIEPENFDDTQARRIRKKLADAIKEETPEADGDETATDIESEETETDSDETATEIESEKTETDSDETATEIESEKTETETVSEEEVTDTEGGEESLSDLESATEDTDGNTKKGGAVMYGIIIGGVLVMVWYAVSSPKKVGRKRRGKRRHE